MHKTGTTSIQNFLQENKQKLSNYDIYVPEQGKWRKGHHNIAWECTADPRFTKENGDFSDVAKELKATTHSKVVMSSEDFGNAVHLRKKYIFLKNYFEELNFQVKIIAYIRPQYKSFDSLYTEQVKQGLHAKNFATFVEDTFKNPKLNFETYFNLWSEFFEDVTILNFDNLDTPLEETFLEALDIGKDAIPSMDLSYTKRVNERIGPKTVEAYRIWVALQNQFGFSPPERNQSRLALAKLCRDKDWDNTKFSALTPAIAQKIINYYKKSNDNFFKKFPKLSDSFAKDANLLTYNKTILDLTKLTKNEFQELIATAEEAVLKVRYP